MILVIKLSGKVLEEPAARAGVCRQIAHLVALGNRVVVVHGGGKQLTEYSQRLGIPVIQYNGRRVTDEATLDVAKMVLSAINRDLTATLIGCGLTAVGLSSFDGKLVSCHKRPPIPVQLNGHSQRVDFGFVGEIDGVNAPFIVQLWKLGLVPVISCLCADAAGQILNINADTLAAEVAVAIQAERLVSVSDVEGIYFDPKDPSTKIPELTADQARAYLREGRFQDGMIPKIEVALNVVDRGVPVQVVSGLVENALLEGIEGSAGSKLTS